VRRLGASPIRRWQREIGQVAEASVGGVAQRVRGDLRVDEDRLAELRRGGEEFVIVRVVEEAVAGTAVDHGADMAQAFGADELVDDVLGEDMGSVESARNRVGYLLTAAMDVSFAALLRRRACSGESGWVPGGVRRRIEMSMPWASIAAIRPSPRSCRRCWWSPISLKARLSSGRARALRVEVMPGAIQCSSMAMRVTGFVLLSGRQLV